MALACEDAKSKLVDIVIVADVDEEEHVGNNLVEILTLKIVQGIEAELLYFETDVYVDDG